MRLLMISNFFPPNTRGGYEMWCQEVAHTLEEKGHQVLVLTSRNDRRRFDLSEAGHIQRALYLEMDFISLWNAVLFFTSRQKRERANILTLRSVVEQYRPDLIYIWGMWNLPRSLAAQAEYLSPSRVVYYIADYWPSLPAQYEFYWMEQGRSLPAKLVRKLLKPSVKSILAQHAISPLEFPHAQFPSRYLKEELISRGISFQDTRIIYGAIDIDIFTSNDFKSKIPKNGKLALLYLGRLVEEKGVHTAIEALDILINGSGLKNVELTIAGSGSADYKTRLENLAHDLSVDQYVKFIGAYPQAALSELFAKFDVLLFTSIWSEPFGRVLVEAMVCSLSVVGTATGGASEVLVDHENGLVYPPGDAEALAGRLLYLRNNPELKQKMVRNGRKMALEHFNIHRMVNEIEDHLMTVLAA